MVFLAPEVDFSNMEQLDPKIIGAAIAFLLAIVVIAVIARTLHLT